jgi:hypothetical protein
LVLAAQKLKIPVFENSAQIAGLMHNVGGGRQ